MITCKMLLLLLMIVVQADNWNTFKRKDTRDMKLLNKLNYDLLQDKKVNTANELLDTLTLFAAAVKQEDRILEKNECHTSKGCNVCQKCCNNYIPEGMQLLLCATSVNVFCFVFPQGMRVTLAYLRNVQVKRVCHCSGQGCL